MNERPPEVLARAVDAIARSPMARIRHRWIQRFGRPLGGMRELVDFVVAEHGLSYSEAGELSLSELADRLMPDTGPAKPDPASLSVADRNILDATPADRWSTGQEIADAAGLEHDAVRQRLRPSFPLRSGGFVQRNAEGNGYRRSGSV